MSPVRVLIVDDAAFMRAMAREILANVRGRDAGDAAGGRAREGPQGGADDAAVFEIAGEATTGFEALERYQEVRPDIVLMDIVMPDMNGVEATRRILELDPLATVAMCSTPGQEPLVLEALAAGAKDFVMKPLSTQSVRALLHSLRPADPR